MKRTIIILLSIIAVIFAIAGIAFGIHKWNQKKAAADETPAATTQTIADNGTQVTPDADDPLADLKLSLTVDIDRHTLDGMYTGYSQEFLDSSMPNRNDERTSAAALVGWGKSGYKMYDAVSFPFSTVEAGKTNYTDEDIAQMYAELQEEIMRNPVVGDMVLQGMQYMILTDNTSIADLNDGWVEDFEEMYDTYGVGAFLTYHTRYWEKYGFELPHDGEDVDAWREAHPDAPSPTAEDLELIPLEENDTPTPATTGTYGRQGQVNGTTVRYKLFVTDYYVRTAKRILTWLDRCTIQGVETYSTTRHWPLNSAVNANKVRTYMNEDPDYVDRQPALIFSVLTKDGTRQILFGFNIYDLRLEIYERTSTPTVQDPDPTPHRQDPDPDPDPNPDPDPDPDPQPDPDPDPDPDPKKDPTDDPVHHGNADTGGGEGRGDTPDDPVPDPSQHDMEDAGGGEDNNGGHSDPSTVQPDDPDPSDGNDDVDNTDSNPDDYGEEDHNQQDPVDDGSGNPSNPDDQEPGGEFDEPPI
jgi:hypothetical protein